MSSTNKTTNYELSQFIGSDKPAWLADYNSDMSKIDAGIHTAATTATGADGKADANTTAIGELESLTTTAKTNLVAAVNEVNSSATAAAGLAENANTNANTALTNLGRFNLTNHADLTPSVTLGSIASGSYMRFASDSTNSIFKLYGRIHVNFSGSTTGRVTLTIGSTTLRPSEAYTIEAGAMYWRYFNTGYQDSNALSITVGTNGVITCEFNRGDPNMTLAMIWLPPCLYFNNDFGDVPQPDNS